MATDIKPSDDSMRAAAASGGESAQEPVVRFNPKSAAEYEKHLDSIAGTGYVPTLPFSYLRDDYEFDEMFFAQIEQMREWDCIKLPLEYSVSPLSYAEFEIEADSRATAEYYRDQLKFFWTHYSAGIYEEGVSYGWAPAQLKTKKQDGLLVQDDYTVYLPLDCDVLRSASQKKPCGILVRGTAEGSLKLTAFRDDLVNKGFWYSHRAKHGMFYGRSELRAAYRPWKRLIGRDGAEETIDLAAYRSGYGYHKYHYPTRNDRVDPSRAGGQVDSSGRTNNLAQSRENASRVKAGSAIHLPSERDEHGNLLWDLEILDAHANLAELMEYGSHLERRCAKAIGVSPELFEAAQTGSGYSGRAIPLQAFLTSRQKPLNALHRQWHEQIGLPLVRHNFGPSAWVRCNPVPLIQSYRKSAWESPGDQGAGQAAPPPQMPTIPQDGDGDGMVNDGKPAEAQDPATLSTDIEGLIELVPTMSVAELEALDALLTLSTDEQGSPEEDDQFAQV